MSDHCGDFVQEQVHGLVVSAFAGHHEFLGVEAVLGGLALDGVGRQRKGRSDKANERRVFLFGFLRELTKDFTNEGEFFVKGIDAIDGVEGGHVSLAGDLGRNDGSNARDDVEVDTQGWERCQNVGKHDDSVHAVFPVALQTQFDGHVGCFGPLAKGILCGIRPEGFHVSTGLAAQPDRGSFGDFSPGGSNQNITIAGLLAVRVLGDLFIDVFRGRSQRGGRRREARRWRKGSHLGCGCEQYYQRKFHVCCFAFDYSQYYPLLLTID
mmetsp:Transcript_33578/g.79181  ORF Transcript_33578/g.79181 Transcript_33578/m.79181 type:complete len:267 (-) Transcript_33578:21-821(-)